MNKTKCDRRGENKTLYSVYDFTTVLLTNAGMHPLFVSFWKGGIYIEMSDRGTYRCCSGVKSKAKDPVEELTLTRSRYFQLIHFCKTSHIFSPKLKKLY